METVKIIQSFLCERTFCVYLGNSHSQQKNIPTGCPQGSCLSPILYNIFTADIPAINNCTISVFADDTSILSSDLYFNNISNSLQNGLSILIEYFCKWNISVNPEKTQAVYFTRKRKTCFLPQTPLVFSNHQIAWETNAKYLGVVLDKKLNFGEHISHIVNKVNKITRIMYPLINRNSELNTENKKLVIKAIFLPIFYYCAPIWSSSANCHLYKLQVAQNKLLKMILNLPWHYSTQRLHALSGFELVKDKIQKITTNFQARCLSSRYKHINDLIS